MRLTTTADIEQASARIRGVAVQTPLVDVSTRARRPLWLKCENLQVTGSFKLRGAYNMVSRLPEEVRRRGVITYSSGNHAQALAYAARVLNVPAVVVMPTTASAIKVDGARGYGAEILREGTTSLERRGRAEQVALDRGLTIVPPFDHEDIVAGQGTVGLEILDALPAVSRVYVPLGGGGLLSGVSAAVVQAKPSAKVIGVEPVGAAKMTASLAAGHPVTLKSVGSVADGLLPVRPGDLTFAHVQRFVDQVVTVPDEAIERAVAWLFRHAKLVVEPSGAAAVAALLADADAGEGATGEKTVAVLSGGNVAPSTLVEIMARAGD
jgi:threonine dehydratase